MAYYFGIIPSDETLAMLDEIDVILNSDNPEPYYKHRNLIAHQVAHELIEEMLVKLIEVMPDSERKEMMIKITKKVESSTDSILSILMTKDKNEDVLPTIDYLYETTLFTDNEGRKRLGFKLNESDAQTIVTGFNAVNTVNMDNTDIAKFKIAIETMSHTIMTHFVTDFANTLPLGIIKRNSVPVAKAGITKVIDIAIHRLLPKLNNAGFNRFANFYRPFIVEISE